MRRSSRSSGATQLLHSLVARTGLDPNRISVGRCHSVDWQSLTFTGERHEFSLRLSGPDPALALAQLRDGLADAEWHLEGQIVADILIVGESASSDGSLVVNLEALTLTE